VEAYLARVRQRHLAQAVSSAITTTAAVVTGSLEVRRAIETPPERPIRPLGAR